MASQADTKLTESNYWFCRDYSGEYLMPKARYVGNLKERISQDQMARNPTEVIRKAVIRMLPRNKLHDVRFYFGPREEAENISRQQAFIRRQASADFEMPHVRRAMIRAQKATTERQ